MYTMIPGRRGVQYVHNEIIIVQYTKNDYFTVHNQLSIVQYTMNLLLSSPLLTNNYCTVHIVARGIMMLR